MIRHVGVRPKYLPLEREEINNSRRRRVNYYEMFPDGGYRIWNDKLLNSGCTGNIETAIFNELNNDLIFCPHCNEWCNFNQFITITEEKSNENANN